MSSQHGVVAKKNKKPSSPLKIVIYKNIKPPKEDTCAICIQPFLAQDELALLKCPHLYHSQCLQPWLTIRNQCPLCRVPVINLYDQPAD